jgi:hypothetical protein
MPPERIELSAFGCLLLSYETNALPLSYEGLLIMSGDFYIFLESTIIISIFKDDVIRDQNAPMEKKMRERY